MLRIPLLIAALATLLASEASAFTSNGRWSTTATDGATAGHGLPVTLTWSIVPDGATLLNAVGGQSRTSDLVADLDSMFGWTSGGSDLTMRPWFPYVEQSFSRWADVSGVNLVYEPADDGANHGTTSNPGVLGVRGDIRLGGAPLDGPGGTYGQSGFIPNADLTLDTSDVARFSDPTEDYFYLRNTLTHEVGHSLGLAHTESSNAFVLMTPFAVESPSYDGPQQDDIRGVHFLYGDKWERGSATGNSDFSAATPLGQIADGQTILLGDDITSLFAPIAPDQNDFLSITSTGDEDYFVFSTSQPALLDLEVTPRGRTYSERPHSNALFTPVFAASLNDLSVDLYREVGGVPELVATFAANGLGDPESAQDVSLPDAGDYFVRVYGDRDAVQMYSLQLSATLVSPPLAGDYNNDGVVDAADYTVWRDALAAGAPLVNETATPGVVDQADYLAWRSNFGATLSAAATPIPEPLAVAASVLAAALTLAQSWRRNCAK